MSEEHDALHKGWARRRSYPIDPETWRLSHVVTLVPDITEERDSGNGRLERADVDHLGCYWNKGRAIGRTEAGL